ncbi:hypothetical protein HYZ06_00990 [Candidatus Daviesbacteria bacterium]|nr:hypothetical protein [Candidatus Daviesbacteria bacterium]
MLVEAPQFSTTPKDLAGGHYDPNFHWEDTIVIARPIERILPPPEVQEPQYQPVELATGLVINHQLRKAKWDSAKEIKRFIYDINAGLENGNNLSEAVNASAGEIVNNIVAYYNEITRQKPFLVHTNRFDEYKGQRRLVGNNGRPVVDAITAEERKGAVLQASQKIEADLLDAPNNSFMVLMSPAGLNGFVGEHGQRLSHLNTEVMIFWKNQNGLLKGGTLVLDLMYQQAEMVMADLGVTKKLSDADELERLANIVRNPILFAFPRSDMTPFEYVLDKILARRGSSDFRLRQQDGSIETRSIAEVRADIRGFDKILELTDEEEKCLAGFRQFILDNQERVNEKGVQQAIINRMGKAVLIMARIYLESKNPDRMIAFHSPQPSASYHEDNFDREIAYLLTRAGCPPGGSSGLRVLSGISLGSGFSGFGGGGKSEWFCIRCGACGALINCVVRPGEKCPVCPAVRQCS